MGHDDHGDLLGASLPMQTLRIQIAQFSNAPFSVLIEGESGSGKDLVARYLHHSSQRSAFPFLSLNCAAIPPGLAESILFGHGKGAFTGAVNTRSGYFAEAGHGTLFLDEVGELTPALQAKLLHVLENGEYQRIGETQARRSHARIIAATNRDLRKEVREGRFRIDLYHRLSVFSILVPPLRDLGQDRNLLLQHFKVLYAKEAGQRPFDLDEQANQRWMDYCFPGNVRELRNIIIRLTAKYAGQTVTEAQLNAELDLMHTGMEEVASHAMDLPVGANVKTMTGLARKHLQVHTHVNLNQILKAWESAYVDAAMNMTHGNQTQAARLLGVNRTTLYSRMQLQQSYKGE
ncbi:regulatory protein, Fis family [Methylobacillus rhizosphaerae]|uniref:Regulatory protein, Fis family n=1 Tax=Methylobacillus rhizosphaerae TaxID=551994 RepID=A0A239AZ25_9PROT|nr:regulatory protein, Fis family [Methylobacillus rhizosphaerae]